MFDPFGWKKAKAQHEQFVRIMEEQRIRDREHAILMAWSNAVIQLLTPKSEYQPPK